jgi:hypothetical protein
MKAPSFFFLLFLFLISCSTDNTQNELLYGNWQAISWTVDGQESGRNVSTVSFEFKADNVYSASFGQQKEEGTFRLQNDKLYTTAQGKVEKMVSLPKISNDTIIMDMNRQGEAEQLTLVRK